MKLAGENERGTHDKSGKASAIDRYNRVQPRTQQKASTSTDNVEQERDMQGMDTAEAVADPALDTPTPCTSELNSKSKAHYERLIAENIALKPVKR